MRAKIQKPKSGLKFI